MPLNAERVWPDGFNGYTFGEPKIDLESEVGRGLGRSEGSGESGWDGTEAPIADEVQDPNTDTRA